MRGWPDYGTDSHIPCRLLPAHAGMNAQPIFLPPMPQKPRTRCTDCEAYLPPTGDCRACTVLHGHRTPIPHHRRCKGCGQTAPEGRRWCPTCLPRHLYDSTTRREKNRQERLPSGLRETILNRLAAGERLPEVAQDLGTTPQAVWGAARVWPWWRHALDEALMAGRPPDVEHGTTQAYRHGGCRCPECREAHHP